MKIKIICFGKLSSEFNSLSTKYISLIKNYSNLTIIELKEKNHKNLEEEINLNTKLLLETINLKENNYLFSIKGTSYTSENLSKLFNTSEITLIIGPSNGLDESLIKFPKISLSSGTFPHQLFRIMVFEQIYRSLSINNNSKYHK